jgi:hypothetical protein
MGGSNPRRATAMVAAAVVAATGCGTAPPIHVLPSQADAGAFDLSGYAVKGPISGATVTAYKLLPDLRRGDALVSTTTDDAGFFGLTLPAYNGDLILVATGGTYVEEALPRTTDNEPKRLSVDVDFVGLAIDYRTNQPATANITPISHLAYHLARYHVRNQHEPAAQAVADAFAHLGMHFGNVPGSATDLEWRTVTPANLADGTGAQLTAAQRASVVLAGLSQLALNISVRAGLSPGGKVNALSLLTALADDLEADGAFDGLGSAGQLLLPSDGAFKESGPSATALGRTTVRLDLAAAIADFVNSPANTSGLTIPDVGGLTAALSADSDPYLFKSSGTTFDVLPPKLTIVSPPPPYTNQSVVAFTIAADDGPNSTGVKTVFARNGDGTVVSGVDTDGGVWMFQSAVTSGAHPDFDIWAVDQANNSGEHFPLGDYHLRLPSLKDTAPPTITQDFSVGSYLDERGLQLTSAAVPPRFAWTGSPHKAAVGPGTDAAIWKSAVRLSWGSQPPTGAELETSNPANVPFVQIGIPFNATTDAPITSVTCQIGVNGGPPATGALVPAGKSSPGILYFDLPFTLETLPALALTLVSPVVFSVTITAIDAAGNATTQLLGSSESSAGTSFYFHILGPPLYVEEDGSYSASGDPRSIYPFALADGTYAGKFSGSNPGELARVARFRVFNPHAVTVPFVPSVSSFLATGTEEWDDLVWPMGTREWDVSGGGCQKAEISPCSEDLLAPQPYQLVPRSPFLCEATSAPASHPNPAAEMFSTSAGLVSAWSSGNEVPAQGYANRILVPPALGSGPGSVVVYVGRPFGSFGLPPYVWTTDGNPDGVPRFIRHLQDAYLVGALVSRSRCNCDTATRPALCDETEVHTFEQRRWTQALTAARENYSGSFTVVPYARVAPERDLGEGVPRSVSFAGSKSY